MAVHGGMRKYGTFQDTSYISIGDEYDKKTAPPSRLVGAHFRTSYPHEGKLSDATFNKFLPVFEGEKYEDSSEEKRNKLENLKKQNVTEKPFRYSSPPKKSTGLGDYYSSLGPKFPHSPDSMGPVDGYGKPRSWKKGDFPSAPKNILTNPPKKGTYGCVGMTIAERNSPLGVVGEYQYLPDEYDRAKAIKREEIAKSKALKITEKPFYPSKPPKKGCAGVPGTTLGGKGAGVCGEYAYVMLGPPPKKELEKEITPFRATSPVKQGYNCTLGKFPPYMEDPLDKKMAEVREKRKEEREKVGARGPFRPNGGLKASASQSILKVNLLKRFP